jgi:taurine dioxygenase
VTVKVTPLSSALGAEISGIDLSQTLEPPTVAAIRSALWDNFVLLFRDQKFSAEDQLRFAECLGPVARRKYPDGYKAPATSKLTPGIAYVSNLRDENNVPVGIIPDGEMWFHHDTCYKPEPDRCTMLFAIEVPETGGHTMWANMAKAWETLPPALKQALDGRRALNVYDYAVNGRPDLTRLDSVEHAWHPAVVPHPESGRKALFVNRLMTVLLDGMSEAESRAVLEPVFDHAEQRTLIYEHRWEPGDFIVWDNLSCTHARTHFATGDHRVLRRCKVSGTQLVS